VAVLPGYFETDLTASYLQSDEYVARLNSRVPLRQAARCCHFSFVGRCAFAVLRLITGQSANNGLHIVL
jgi:hypothetical protein